MAALKDKKVLFIDLDDTLIKTVSGKTFPEDISDFRIQLPVLNKIIEKFPNLEYFLIVTNQGGVGTYFTQDDIETKISFVCQFCQCYLADHVEDNKYQYLKANWTYCDSIDKSHPDRKPNTGMLERHSRFYRLGHNGIEHSQMIMIGDASGKEGDFSDSDKKCAENFGIDYIDVRDFLNI